MALSKSTLDAIASAVVAAVTAAMGAPVAAQAAAPAPLTFATKADIAAGDGFPCTAPEPCRRSLRTSKRAGAHGIEAGGHEAR